MKKYYIFSMISILLLLSLQIGYIRTMYKEYIATFINDVDNDIYIALDQELHIRTLVKDHKILSDKTYMSFEPISKISVSRKDSLLKINPLPPKPPQYDVEELRHSGIIRHSAEIMAQIVQDQFFDDGYPLNVYTLDSLISANYNVKFQHTTILYNKKNEILSQSNNCDTISYKHRSIPHMIGINSRQQVVLYYNIPLSPFLITSIWSLVASLLIVGIVVVSLIMQLIIIRRKQERLDHIDQNITGTIHDLKSPLSGLAMTLGAAKKYVQSDELKRIFSLNQSNVKQLLETIDSLLSVARKDNGCLILQKKEITTSHLLESINIIIHDLDNIYQNKPHSINIQNNLPEDYSFNADPIYIESVLRNLIENSLKYSDANVKITVTLQNKDNNITFAISDNGWGIQKKHFKKLFKAYFRLPRAQAIRGYGVGLSYVKYIIKEHQGQLNVESKEGLGSTFYVTLPKI